MLQVELPRYFLNRLVKLRKKKTDSLKAGKNKAKIINNFDLSDDEDKHRRTKKVSFLKTQRISSPSNGTTASESQEKNEPLDSHTAARDSSNGSASSQRSTDDAQFKNARVDSADPQITRESSSKSLSYQTSDDTLLDMPLPLPSDSSVVETPGPEQKSGSTAEERSQTSQLSTCDLNHTASADSVSEREPPRPKPRQRTLGLSFHTSEKPAEDLEDLSRPQTSSISIPLSTDTSGTIAWTEGDHTVSPSSNKSARSALLTKSTVDSGSKDGFISDDSKEQERNYSTSFEEFTGCSGDPSAHLSHVSEESVEARTLSSHSKTTPRSQSACSRKVESKYLGSLKVLDRKVSLQESQPQEADSLRAAIYQEWLKKKKEKSRQNIQLKKKEAMLKEKKEKEEEAKKEDAVSFYEAWKKKKAESLKSKAREKEAVIRKEQKAAEEKEEKRQTAQQVFEKWKREHDHLLKENHRKQKEAENELKLKNKEQEEARKRDSRSAFSNWCEKKKEVIDDKFMSERKEIKNKAEEEKYMKEERDKMALEVYENWLARKDLEQKRRREERRIQEILGDSPPPPWSPPNKTIPFRR
ncbi:microtubule-associated protein 9 isoform X2 [Neolamprologus brichardi]|uniref:microtubule-associated protein 9 isoform X2 n=1 Tax=Neolamprologus brichardi TaxID=32507 RepID=UPI001643A5EB|nr:microtubule-associated protein 9 isoform X2 [Neolamprologus brichardi]